MKYIPALFPHVLWACTVWRCRVQTDEPLPTCGILRQHSIPICPLCDRACRQPRAAVFFRRNRHIFPLNHTAYGRYLQSRRPQALPMSRAIRSVAF
ncbi:hypothetical protein PR003_g30335 [Phytophthora rubi]|uniref:Uncharacterized protein n=1 Tax=Phytophthora rubi TaxID=129364 RepID=A0A6A4BB00_9STRA|nr:hypothetical protein PR001_g32317 [Phytophthora rubi]KAE8966309.1 hypothetical protein PR002_g28402 [Phytophthora rubi]KAE9272016.1 hypothetical protein PR003_g30335 [Phytophthora rubi]